MVHLNLIDWKTFSQYCRGCCNSLIFFLDFVDFFVKTFEVFELLGQIWGFLSNVGMFRYERGLLVHLNLIDWKTHFTILQRLL